jgi:hypothetical protein
MTIALATGHTVFDGAWRLTTPSVVIIIDIKRRVQRIKR